MIDVSELRIRALAPDEREVVRRLFAGLSPRTRYLRLFTELPVLPDPLLDLLTSVEGCRRVALVAEYARGGVVEPVGLASFHALNDCDAELGLVVRDDWQRRRVGTHLALRILDAAEACGFHRFIATITVDNVAIQRVLRRVGDVVSKKVNGAIVELAFVRRVDH